MRFALGDYLVGMLRTSADRLRRRVTTKPRGLEAATAFTEAVLACTFRPGFLFGTDSVGASRATVGPTRRGICRRSVASPLFPDAASRDRIGRDTAGERDAAAP